jgi:hypothetical protein
MFRIGGSTAEGITSGLDQHQPTASRVGFSSGKSFEKWRKDMGFSTLGEIEKRIGQVKGGNETIGEEYKRTKTALDKVRPERRPYWPQFATSFGLDLLTRPASGNIFQQAAASAKGPYEKWMADRASRYDTDDKLSAALFGDVMDIRAQRELKEKELESEERIAQIEAGAPGKDKQFEYKGKLEDYEKLIEEGQALANRLKDLESVEPIPGVPGGPQKDEAAIAEVKDKIEKNAKLQALFADKEEDPIRAAILKGIPNMVTTFADLIYYDQTKQIPPGLLEEKAEGGRVGYQMGGATDIPSAVPAAMPTDQGAGQDDSVQDLSFEELRARLPQEITDDIIQLIVSSKQALVEFANIRTQQDVNAFNQKYDVNLVVPQEA